MKWNTDSQCTTTRHTFSSVEASSSNIRKKMKTVFGQWHRPNKDYTSDEELKLERLKKDYHEKKAKIEKQRDELEEMSNSMQNANTKNCAVGDFDTVYVTHYESPDFFHIMKVRLHIDYIDNRMWT